MNDPDPSLSTTSSKADRPANGTKTDSNDADPHQPQQNWFSRLVQGWLSGLTNPSLRSQMEGALSDENNNDQTFSAEEKAMLRNILELREMRVSDVMVPRADIDAVEDAVTLGTLLAVYQDVGHSRLPVYRETLDDPVGMVHIKDVLSLLTKECSIPEETESPALDSMEGSSASVHYASDTAQTLTNMPRTLSNINLDRPLKDLGVIREVLFVPPSMQAIDLMATMRAARTQMALVIDEYGGTDGLVSLEDVVETVVGDIEDEHDDEDEVFIASAGPNLFIADAKAELDDVVEAIGTSLPFDDVSMEDVDTLGGFIFTLIGRIPVRGELITVKDGLEFEIMEADRRRIRRVKIRFKPTKKPIKRTFTLHRGSGPDTELEKQDQKSDAAAE